MQFDLNQSNTSRSLSVSSIITMVLHLGYSTVEQSLVGTTHFLAIVDAQIVVDARLTVNALEVGSMLKQVMPVLVEIPCLMEIEVHMVVEYVHGTIVM